MSLGPTLRLAESIKWRFADSPEVSFWEIPNCEAINGFQRGAAKTVSTMQNAKSLTDTVFHSTMLRHFVPQ